MAVRKIETFEPVTVGPYCGSINWACPLTDPCQSDMLLVLVERSDASRAVTSAPVHHAPRWHSIVGRLAACRLHVVLGQSFESECQLTKRDLANMSPFGSFPTAGGGIARAAYLAAIKARLDTDALLRNSGLTAAQLKNSDTRIAVKNQIKFLSQVSSALQDDFLGIHLAQVANLRELGLLYYVLASSDTLGDALARAARYSMIQNEGVQLTLRQQKYLSVRLEYFGISRGNDRHQIEFFVLILLRLCRELTGRRLLPEIIQFTHHRNNVPADVKAVFASSIRFKARVDEIVFPVSARSVPIVNADPYLNAVLLRYCEEVLSKRRVKEGAWRVKVENAIAPLLPHGEASVQKVAQILGVSRRTLARRLGDENVTFIEALNELRLGLARQYLCEDGLEIAEVAWLLGYQETSAFSHAVKRWTGKTPTQWRSREAGSN
jgi:AraC-like DNA-binding protein